MPWAVVGAVVGGVISADAADSASDAQVGAARDANALQKYIFDMQRQDQQPWRDAGLGGLNRLAYLMGISPTGYGGGGSGSMSGGLETADQIRARLSGAYTTRTQGPYIAPQGAGGADSTPGSYGPETVTVDNAKLDAAVQAEMARQQKALDQHNRLTAKGARGDSQYGSLLDTFDMKDFRADPGYQFQLAEGQKALDRRLAAGGQFYSGRSLKDSMSYNQGMANQEFGKAYDRFNNNQDRMFNKLGTLSGIGQVATNNIGSAAQNYGNRASDNLLSAGAAQAGGIVGSANAWNNAIGQGASAFQQNRMMGGGGGGWGGMQAGFSQTGLGSSGFGTGLAYGNQDYGQYF